MSPSSFSSKIVLLIVEPGAVTNIDITPSVDSFTVTWKEPEQETGPTNYTVEACMQEVDYCDNYNSCSETIVAGMCVYSDGKNEMHVKRSKSVSKYYS